MASSRTLGEAMLAAGGRGIQVALHVGPQNEKPWDATAVGSQYGLEEAQFEDEPALIAWLDSLKGGE